MKNIYAFVLFMMATGVYAQTPEFRWANAIGDSSDQVVIHFVIDTAGEVYVAGHFNGTTDFDPGPGTANLVSAGSTDIFVARYAKDGSLIWNFRIGGNGPDEALDIGIHNDLFYIVGTFSDTVDFDPILGGAFLTSVGGKDIFIANFDNTGFLLFANRIGGPGADVATAVALDDSANVYVAGSFTGTVDFDPGAGIANLITGGAPTDAFLAKYSYLGVYRWAFDFGSGTLADAGTDVACDDSGNVFTTGIFQQTNVDFDPDPVNTAYLTSAGSNDGYVAGYTRGGDYLWAFNLGGSSSDRCSAVAVDTANDVLITGRFTGTNIDFDPSPGGTRYLNSGTSNDIFVAKYDGASGSHLWSFQLGNSSANEEAADITANPYNNQVIATGYFLGTADFNPSAGTNNMASAGGSEDAYVAAYEASGLYAWSFKIGGNGPDMGTQVRSYRESDTIRLYVAGNFIGTVDFNPGAGVNPLTSATGVGPGQARDLFIAQYKDPTFIITGMPTVQGPGEHFQLYPNPAQDLLNIVFDAPVKRSQLTVRDLQGKIVARVQGDGTSAVIDVSRLDAGIYFLTTEDAKGVSYSRFSVVR